MGLRSEVGDMEPIVKIAVVEKEPARVILSLCELNTKAGTTSILKAPFEEQHHLVPLYDMFLC